MLLGAACITNMFGDTLSEILVLIRVPRDFGVEHSVLIFRFRRFQKPYLS
jgi:hypothetical protein